MSSLLSCPSLLPSGAPSSDFSFFRRRSNVHRPTTHTSSKLPSINASTSSSRNSGNEDSSSKSVKLVTFLGKGGSGKTTSAILAAQHYAMSGLRTCLVVQTQDPSAEYLLNCKIGTSPSKCNGNLSAVRLETTKMLLEPLDLLKQADARLKLTQGVLEAVVGEELGVLPAMDSIFALLKLARLMGLFTSATPKNNGDKFDIIIYDGISADESLRMMGAASKARLYLKYLRNLAEKTDLGRLASPSLLRLLDEAVNLSGSNSHLNGNTSAEIWNSLEKMLERGSSAFHGPDNFRCYLVMDPRSPTSVNSALRYWGCTIQAGAHISGAIGVSPPHLSGELVKEIKNKFLPLPFAFAPHLSTNDPLDWNSLVRNTSSQEVRALFSLPSSHSSSMTQPVKYDMDKKSVTLFLPGFDKSEIKLYQYRGGSELLVEAGDQRRVICLPSKVQGKVSGAKFIDRSLVITMR